MAKQVKLELIFANAGDYVLRLPGSGKIKNKNLWMARVSKFNDLYLVEECPNAENSKRNRHASYNKDDADLNAYKIIKSVAMSYSKCWGLEINDETKYNGQDISVPVMKP